MFRELAAHGFNQTRFIIVTLPCSTPTRYYKRCAIIREYGLQEQTPNGEAKTNEQRSELDGVSTNGGAGGLQGLRIATGRGAGAATAC